MARNLWANEKCNRMNQETTSWFSNGKKAVVRKLLLGCLTILCVAVLMPSPGLAKPKKPKLDKDDNCVISLGCSSGLNKECSMLYCRALREKCKGDYSSGACKDIKDEQKEAGCSDAKENCGETLPRILTIGNLQVDISSGEVFVVTDPEDDTVDFSTVFDAAAEAAAMLDPKTCLDRCLSKVGKECAAACQEICAPGIQNAGDK